MKFDIKHKDHGKMLINAEFEELLDYNGISTADDLWSIQSDSVKNILQERGTGRCMLSSPNGHEVETYIKRYQPIPLREVIKNMMGFKPFHFDGIHEWNAIIAFHELELNTMQPIAAARFRDGRSCNLTLGIRHYTRGLELFKELNDSQERKERLICSIAEMIGRMHSNGMAHQDMYLVHLFIKEKENDAVYLIDLQRMIMQRKLSRRWRVKDLGQFLFSAWEFLGENERKLFTETYSKHAGLSDSSAIFSAAIRKAERIRQHDQRRRERLNLGAD